MIENTFGPWEEVVFLSELGGIGMKYASVSQLFQTEHTKT